MNFSEAIYIEDYRKIGMLLTEQKPFQTNVHFDCTQATNPPHDNLGLATRLTTQGIQRSEKPT